MRNDDVMTYASKLVSEVAARVDGQDPDAWPER
jgi:hypothetical protein